MNLGSLNKSPSNVYSKGLRLEKIFEGSLENNSAFNLPEAQNPKLVLLTMMKSRANMSSDRYQ